MVRHVEKTLSSPVRSALTAWISDSGVSNSERKVPSFFEMILVLGLMHDIMLLVSLQLGLERVDGAKTEIFDVSAA
ncbi:hypothetical protein L208DRAFT_1411855 [Tricholoma matsutake]|nr:hypothetical protein L208DRAFT_1411855 [Tricholoma matsutake 945]